MRIFFVHRSKNVPAETDKIYVYILRSKCGRTPELLSQNACGSQFLLDRKGISIVARTYWQKYVYIPRSKCGRTPELLS